MAVVIETTAGDITIDLFVSERPQTCKNFLKLCKIKYYNFCLFHSIQHNFIAQTGDPSGSGKGGESIFGKTLGEKSRYYEGEQLPKIRHYKAGLVSMVNCGGNMLGSQFFITLANDLQSLDGEHCVFGEITEGEEVLMKLNDAICDNEHRPYQDIRITHTVVLEDPFDDPPGLVVPDGSPEPTKENMANSRIAPDEEIDDTTGRSAAEIEEMVKQREAQARATILEMVGDLPDADIAPPENVLFVCKLNPVTTDDDLEIIFSRFGKINSCEVIRDKISGDSLQYAFIEFDEKKSCEDAYFKMDNVLIDDRRIHVDFSQSVSKYKWLGKGRGVKVVESGETLVKKEDGQHAGRHGNASSRQYQKDERARESGRDRERDRDRERERDRERDRDRDRHRERERDRERDRERERDRDRRDRDRDRDYERDRDRERVRDRERRDHREERESRSNKDRGREHTFKDTDRNNDKERKRRDEVPDEAEKHRKRVETENEEVCRKRDIRKDEDVCRKVKRNECDKGEKREGLDVKNESKLESRTHHEEESTCSVKENLDKKGQIKVPDKKISECNQLVKTGKSSEDNRKRAASISSSSSLGRNSITGAFEDNESRISKASSNHSNVIISPKNENLTSFKFLKSNNELAKHLQEEDKSLRKSENNPSVSISKNTSKSQELYSQVKGSQKNDCQSNEASSQVQRRLSEDQPLSSPIDKVDNSSLKTTGIKGSSQTEQLTRQEDVEEKKKDSKKGRRKINHDSSNGGSAKRKSSDNRHDVPKKKKKRAESTSSSDSSESSSSSSESSYSSDTSSSESDEKSKAKRKKKKKSIVSVKSKRKPKIVRLVKKKKRKQSISDSSSDDSSSSEDRRSSRKKSKRKGKRKVEKVVLIKRKRKHSSSDDSDSDSETSLSSSSSDEKSSSRKKRRKESEKKSRKKDKKHACAKKKNGSIKRKKCPKLKSNSDSLSSGSSDSESNNAKLLVPD